MDKIEMQRRIDELEADQKALRDAILDQANSRGEWGFCPFCYGTGRTSMQRALFREHLREQFHKPFTWDSLMEESEAWRKRQG